MPATRAFVARYPHLFEADGVEAGVGQHLTLRRGAPLLQMLEAPLDFVEGSAEPWIVDVLCALLKASDQRSVLECGAFVGATTVRLAHTVAAMGGGRVAAIEIDPTRAQYAQARLEQAQPTCEWRIVQDDVLKYLASVPNESVGFAWVDDDHSKEHVVQEVEALLPKMAPGGLITFHDVHGSCDLQEIVLRYRNAIALDLPRLGPAGGLGILQV